MKYLFYAMAISFLLLACTSDQSSSDKNIDTASIKIFEDIPVGHSGLDFKNQLAENERYNFMREQGMLIGAGVAILDVNNDGLQDIYFAANMTADKLYLNKGDFVFEDISSKSGITANYWSTGVAVVDINADGYDDIYVCQFLENDPGRRKNIFYINNKNNTFTNKAESLGLADPGHSVMANFFDFDRDGDLDVYVANQPPNSAAYRDAYQGINDFQYTDRLYRNDNGKFKDVTELSGVKNYSYSLSATSIDYNKDGWPDLYVGCDYEEPDFFYKNNGNGTFTNVANEVLKHMSNFSMGAAVADINNDGQLDLYVSDMVAEDNFRQKTNMSGMNPERFFKLASVGYHYQYMANVLQLNNGDNSFSDIAQLSGVSNTDWSWSPLFMDLDQDGYKDLIVTNGIFREIRNKDFEKWRIDWFQKYSQARANNTAGQMNPMDVINKAPSVKIANYVFKNNGDLSFSKQNTNWGLAKKTWSQGAAYADFDNDGDLDLVVNNTNMLADLYKNTANENKLNNYLSVTLEGPRLNINGHNATIEIVTNSGKQLVEYSPYRGYMSSSQRIAHFGLGKDSQIKELRVLWHDNKMNVLQDLSTNQTVHIKYAEAKQQTQRGHKPVETIFMRETIVNHSHIENKFDDYKAEILLPYQTSTLGPILAKGDVNGDGHEDLFVGGSVGQPSQLFINDGKGKMTKSLQIPSSKQYEDGGALFVDIDGDTDLDLYIASGGNEFQMQSDLYQDRLLLNNGKGVFSNTNRLPTLTQSTGKVLNLDFDNDGDQDLLVFGRLIPGQYGRPASSYLLENNEGRFTDVTNTRAPFLNELGMVTDAAIHDLSNDGKVELIIVGEWMPIQIYSLGEEWKNVTADYNLANTNGWWNTLKVTDLNNDGAADLIVGNLGYNIKYKASKVEPFKAYIDDFDKDGSNDVYLGYYNDGACYPVRGRQCSSQQMPFVSTKFKDYTAFGTATIDQVLEDHISESTQVLSANTFASTIFLNKGHSFEPIVLPNEAQVFPVYGIEIDDFDNNGSTDIFLAGNM